MSVVFHSTALLCAVACFFVPTDGLDQLSCLPSPATQQVLLQIQNRKQFNCSIET